MENDIYSKALKFLCDRAGLEMSRIILSHMSNVVVLSYRHNENYIDAKSFWCLTGHSKFYVPLKVDFQEYNHRNIMSAVLNAATYGNVYLGGHTVFVKKNETLESLLIQADLETNEQLSRQ